MSPDLPIQHSLYSPLGQEKSTSDVLVKKVLSQTPILKERLDYLQSRIAFYRSPQAFPKEAETDDKIHMATLWGINRLLPMLETELRALQNQISEVGLQIERSNKT